MDRHPTVTPSLLDVDNNIDFTFKGMGLIGNKMHYAGIGSRSTPVDVLEKFKTIGSLLSKIGYVLRSGGADGADSAFELGCDLVNGKKEIFLPWKKFNGNDSNLYNTPKEAEKIVEKIHPIWNKLKLPVKELHKRNVCQILGYSLKDPVKFVICYTENGSGKGGTATAINLAKSLGILVFDFGKEESKNQFKTFILNRHKLDNII